MLETLNHLLTHSEPSKRDLFVELCLTVPVRLTNLLPHLGYLMKPLVYALNAGTDLVNQGLRTLELCIDNLTAEFLDPTMAPVLRDLMNALYNLLKPVPFDHLHSHAAVKILGKLGGRNRRFQQMPYLLEYQPSGEEIFAKLQVDGTEREFEVSKWINIAVGQLRNPSEANRAPAVNMLKQCSLLFMTEVCRDTCKSRCGLMPFPIGILCRRSRASLRECNQGIARSMSNSGTSRRRRSPRQKARK